MKDKSKEKLPAFEVIGSKGRAVAIVEIPETHENKAKEIARELMKRHKSVVSVLAKSSPREGELRLRKYRLITGDEDTEVVHTEYGCRIKVDVQKTYFSPREGVERERVAEQVQDGEFVLVFFAGVGPYCILIGKKAKAGKIVGIELNSDAVRYFRDNIKLNKLPNVEAIEGDVHKIASQFYGTVDRVVMPLPEKSFDFIADAIRCLKQSGVCNFYFFAKESELDFWQDRVQAVASNENRAIQILRTEPVSLWGPRIWKWRMDFRAG